MTTKTTTTKRADDLVNEFASEAAKHQAEMQAAFSKVSPKGDWKAPISAIFHGELDDVKIVCEAIEYMTATKATARPIGLGSYHVTADGYRRGPAH